MKNIKFNMFAIVLITLFAVIISGFIVTNCTKQKDTLNRKENNWEKFLFMDVKKRLASTPFQNLRDKDIPANSEEVRIWIPVGRSSLRGLIFRKLGDKWEGQYVTPNNSLENIDSCCPFLKPNSGWANFWKKVNKLDFYKSFDSVDIEEVDIYPDAQIAIVEIKNSDHYWTYMYQGLETGQGKEIQKILSILDIFSEEFGIEAYR